MFLVFSNQELAQLACNRIFNNIRDWLIKNYSIRVHPLGLISVNYDGTPNLKGQVTTEWAKPEICQEGWYLPKPDQKSVGLVPLEIVLVGVGGEEMAQVTAIENE